MLKNPSAPTAPKRLARTSSRPSEVLRWFGNASIVVAVIAGSAMASTMASAQQAESMHQPGHRVALIDVLYIFKNLPAIEVEVNKVKDDLKREEAKYKQKRDALKESAEQLKAMKVGTAEYARQEEHVANLESKLRLDRIHCHRKLSDAEVKVYFDNYQRIAAAVRAVATHNDIQLVLRYRSEEMDPEQSDSVARGVMKNVLYHDSTIDMTPTVMQYLIRELSDSG